MHDIDRQLEKETAEAMLKIVMGITINAYAEENLALNRIRPYDTLPVETYFADLNFQHIDLEHEMQLLDGLAISNGVIVPVDYEEIYFDLFRSKADKVFAKAPKHKMTRVYDDSLDIMPYKNGLYEYLKKVYDIFRDVITFDAACSIEKNVSNNASYLKNTDYFEKLTEFIADIKIRPIGIGTCVDKYLKDLPYISPYVQRLVTKEDGHFYLTENDAQKTEYITALFSCFDFSTEYNTKLFESRMLRWEKQNRA